MSADDPGIRVRLDGADYVFEPGEEVSIGRGEDALVRSVDPAVSRAHATLCFLQGRWVFLDAGSKYGSYLAGRPIGRIDITGPTALRLGDPDRGELLEIAPEVLIDAAPNPAVTPRPAVSRTAATGPPAPGAADSAELTDLLDRIAEGAHSPADVKRLRRAVNVKGDRRVVQVGKYNVPIQQGRDIHIGDRVYQGADAEAIREVLSGLAWGGPARGSLRGVGGAIVTLGMLIALAGMGMFFYGLISAMSGGADAASGPPPVILKGFGVAAAGVFVGIIGGLVTGWSKARSKR